MDTVLSTAREAIPESVFQVAALIALITVLLIIGITFYRWLYMYHRSYVWFEMTPPNSVKESFHNYTQFFNVIHGLSSFRSLKDKLLRIPITLSCEITSTKQSGICYVLQIPSEYALTVQSQLVIVMNGSLIKTIEKPHHEYNQVVEFKLTNSYLHPLKSLGDLKVDPLTNVLSTMTSLGDRHVVTLQLIVQPMKLKNARTIARQILENENVVHTENSKLEVAGSGITSILNGFTSVFSEVANSSLHGHRLTQNQSNSSLEIVRTIKTDRPNRSISYFEQSLLQTIEDKIKQPIFSVSYRLVSDNLSKNKLRSIVSSMDGFSTPPYQSIRIKRSLPIIQSIRLQLASRRLPTVRSHAKLNLSSSELAGLYHVAATDYGRTENLQSSLARTLPAPVTLKQSKPLSIYIGENHHQGTVTPIGLTEAERERHTYIIGGTGNGKTTILQYKIVQDIKKGNGVAVIDPHGDMAEYLLTQVPEERINDVIYFDPSDFDHPIGMNLLELDRSLTGSVLLHQKDLITESVVSVFRKIFSDEDSGGHRIEYILRNAIQTALTVEDATIFTVFELLNDPVVRRKVTSALTDVNLKNFWQHELAKAGDMQRVKMAAGITSKIGRFLFSASAYQILGQSKSTIDFEEIMNSKKILICNFSKGNLGEDTSELFGVTVLAKIQLASLHRAKIAPAKRVPFYLYVDEFQNFATQSFVQMLSESRKYRLSLTMAEQSTSQQSDQQMVNIILANVGTVITFKTGNPADESILLPLFSPYVNRGEISNLPTYQFYAKLSAVNSQEPLSGVTVLLPAGGDAEVVKKIIKHSQKHYGSERVISSISSKLNKSAKARSVKRLSPAERIDG